METVITLITVISMTEVISFNLDIENIRELRSDSDQKGSYFGYSTAFYNDNNKRTRLLIGAPRYHRDGFCDDTYNQGRVFTCDVSDAGSRSNVTCQPWAFDEKCFSNMGLMGFVTNKTNSWFGVSLSTSKYSQSDVMVCGHRYMVQDQLTWSRVNDVRMIGSCFKKSRSPSDFNSRANQMSALDDESSLTGLSVQYDKGTSDFLIGTPGASLRRGGKVTSTGTLLSYRKPWQAGSATKNSYAGYAITSGRFSMNGGTTYVIGAPRYNMSGKVYLQNKNSRRLSGINSNQMGSQFGASLQACDIDGDTVDELVVGAPQWKVSEGDEGRVFIYKHNGTHMQLVKVLSGKKQGGRFGFAISCDEDMERDGYNDLIISAPYEDSGILYIFNGRREGIHATPSQIIRGTDATSEVLSFGSSLSAVQFNNNYPVIAVGAYQTDKAFLVFTKPVIRLHTELHLAEYILIKDGQCINDSCSSLFVNISYTGDSVPSNIVVDYKISLDVNKIGPRIKAASPIMLQGQANVTLNETWVLEVPLLLMMQPHDFLSPIVVQMSEKIQFTESINNSRAVVAPKPITQASTNFKMVCQVETCVYDSKPRLVIGTPSGERFITYKDKRLYHLFINISNTGDTILFPQVTSQLPSGTVFHSVKVNQGSKDSSCFMTNQKIQCTLGSILLHDDSVQIDVTFTPGHVTENATFSAIVGSGAVVEDSENCSSVTSLSVMTNVDLQMYGHFQAPDLFITESSSESSHQVISQHFNFRLDNRGPGSTVAPTYMMLLFRNVIAGIKFASTSQKLHTNCFLMQSYGNSNISLDILKNRVSTENSEVFVCKFGEIEFGGLEQVTFYIDIDKTKALELMTNTGRNIIDLTVKSWALMDTIPGEGNPSVLVGPKETILNIHRSIEVRPVKHFPWILFAAVIGGTVFLIICVIILYKVGFFKRSHKDALKQIKRKSCLGGEDRMEYQATVIHQEMESAQSHL